MPEINDVLSLPQQNDAVLDFLKSRRSNLAKVMSGPGPDKEELDALLTIAARVPDHRKLTPWRFLTFTDEAREDFGKHLGAIFAKENPGLPVDRTLFESSRLMRAPMIVAVISSPVDCPRGTPKWEQILSSGAACYNLLIAAQASGWAAQWLTEWYAFHPEIDRILGLSGDEKVAGYIYIGSTDEPPVERKRANVAALTQPWRGGR